jgi:hypothetical protein
LRRRRLVVLAASGALLALFISSEPPRLVARRAAFLTATASRPLPERRLAGSGAAFDRRFFRFLEAARRALPPGMEGVALDTSRDAAEELYLASYHLAPLPVVFTPQPVPPRWASATYGVAPPAGWRVVARLPGGELSVPP